MITMYARINTFSRLIRHAAAASEFLRSSASMPDASRSGAYDWSMPTNNQTNNQINNQINNQASQA